MGRLLIKKLLWIKIVKCCCYFMTGIDIVAISGLKGSHGPDDQLTSPLIHLQPYSVATGVGGRSVAPSHPRDL